LHTQWLGYKVQNTKTLTINHARAGLMVIFHMDMDWLFDPERIDGELLCSNAEPDARWLLDIIIHYCRLTDW